MQATTETLYQRTYFCSFSIAFGLLSAWIVWNLGHFPTDTGAHQRFAEKVRIGEHGWPPNFLYYTAIIFTGDLLGHDELRVSSAILLGIAGAAKAYLTLSLLRYLAPQVSVPTYLLCAIAILFSFSLPVAFVLGKTLHYFLGSLPPNVWHNATTMFLMPLAIAAFMLQLKDFDDRRPRRVVGIMLLIALGIVAKPSYFFVYAPSVALLSLILFEGMRDRLLGQIPNVVGTALVFILFVQIYMFQQGSHQEDPSSLTIAPFQAWSEFLPLSEVPLAIFGSFCIPIVYAALSLRPERPIAMAFATLQLLVGLVLFILVAEVGPRERHGNMIWNGIVASYFLHLVILADLIVKAARDGISGKILFCLGLFLCTTYSGLIYLFRLLTASSGFLLPY